MGNALLYPKFTIPVRQKHLPQKTLKSVIFRSFTQLVKRHHSATSRQEKPIANFEDRLFDRKVARERAYSAKLPNRYNSVSYTQQY